MKLENKKKLFNSTLIIVLIFFLDRFSKIYVLSLAKINNSVDIFVTEYLNIYLIWNEGIAYGLLSFGQSSIYNIITVLIVIISLVVYVLIIKTNDIRFYFYSLVFGGATPTRTTATEEYNGTSWTNGGSLGTAQYQLAGAGTQTAGLAFGGAVTPPFTKVLTTSEYNGRGQTGQY